MSQLLAAAGVQARHLHKLHSFGEAGVPTDLISPSITQASGRLASHPLPPILPARMHARTPG